MFHVLGWPRSYRRNSHFWLPIRARGGRIGLPDALQRGAQYLKKAILRKQRPDGVVEYWVRDATGGVRGQNVVAPAPKWRSRNYDRNVIRPTKKRYPPLRVFWLDP